MKYLVIIFIFSIMSFPVLSSDLIMQNDDSKRYLNISPVKKVSACLHSSEMEKKIEYNNAYTAFIKNINLNKKDFINYDDVINGISKAKKFHDGYIRNECFAFASQLIKDSPAYQGIYSQCMINFYRQRIDFYKTYDFE